MSLSERSLLSMLADLDDKSNDRFCRQLKAVADVDVEHLVDRLNLSPFRV